MVKQSNSTRKWFEVSQCTVNSEDLWPEVCPSSSSWSRHHQEEHKDHWGDEIATNVHMFPLRSQGFVHLILPFPRANLRKILPCCLEFRTIEVSLVCHVLFPKPPYRLQIADSGSTSINKKIPLLGASTLLVDDAQGLGNLTDPLPHFIIYQLFCPATHIMPNCHGFCCRLADSNTGILSADTDL
jgi:hypothetical protein